MIGYIFKFAHIWMFTFIKNNLVPNVSWWPLDLQIRFKNIMRQSEKDR